MGFIGCYWVYLQGLLGLFGFDLVYRGLFGFNKSLQGLYGFRPGKNVFILRIFLCNLKFHSCIFLNWKPNSQFKQPRKGKGQRYGKGKGNERERDREREMEREREQENTNQFPRHSRNPLPPCHPQPKHQLNPKCILNLGLMGFD